MFRTGSAAGPGTLEQQWDGDSRRRTRPGPAQGGFRAVVPGCPGHNGNRNLGVRKAGGCARGAQLHFVRRSDLRKLVDFSYRVTAPQARGRVPHS